MKINTGHLGVNMAEAVVTPVQGTTTPGQPGMSIAVTTTFGRSARDHEAIIGVPTRIETAKAIDRPMSIAEAEVGVGVGVGAHNDGGTVRHIMEGPQVKRRSWKGYRWILQKQTFATTSPSLQYSNLDVPLRPTSLSDTTICVRILTK